MGIGTALKAFSAALFNQEKSAMIEQILSGQPAAPAQRPAIEAAQTLAPQTSAPQPKAPAKPARDSAVTLLATLQRESRLVDLLQEDLAQYSDAQVGAAARPCLQQCSGVLKRLFDIQPLVDGGEGTVVDVPSDSSPIRYQWVGEGTSGSAKLIHQGWRAAKVELPQWTGTDADANVIAPAQVQSQ
ncbi:hypothetical protein K227x_36990 [Rubripirellula lacrimiformis]|uniref:DUF2760 domain-containing protein n=1 Tax=Rubripirellula lacrimiformis TaxID=1930273 RepID=A0A517NDU2_9BACT|nr:DUF2760 domain-containing protein [Rubripirellula lacrimiformis]QDT05299.1 hypothetical protein K227x_36990 [Rubripirellula lacrimiformis]